MRLFQSRMATSPDMPGRDGSPSRPPPAPPPWPNRRRMPHDCPPWVKNGDVFFITIACVPRHHNHLALLPVASEIEASLRHQHRKGHWWVHLFLLMPDHLHGLLSFSYPHSLHQLETLPLSADRRPVAARLFRPSHPQHPRPERNVGVHSPEPGSQRIGRLSRSVDFPMDLRRFGAAGRRCGGFGEAALPSISVGTALRAVRARLAPPLQTTVSGGDRPTPDPP
mgnify:CR=1 FL=1